jgi:hypothetical protein
MGVAHRGSDVPSGDLKVHFEGLLARIYVAMKALKEYIADYNLN